jgi:TPR repeat protein
VSDKPSPSEVLKMTRNLYKLTSHLLPLIAFLFIANVGKGAELDAETKALIARAEQGDALAQFNLGVKYANGEGVPQDYKAAVKWYRKAAEQGHALSQSRLGYMYYNGEGVLKDDVNAYAWFNVGSANGSDQGSKNRDLIAKLMTPEQGASSLTHTTRVTLQKSIRWYAKST